MDNTDRHSTVIDDIWTCLVWWCHRWCH